MLGTHVTPGYTLGIFYKKATLKKLSMHRRAVKGAAELLSERFDVKDAAEVSIFLIDLSRELRRGSTLFLRKWMSVDATVTNYTQIVLYDRLRPYLKPKSYEGLMVAESIAQFVWMHSLPLIVRVDNSENVLQISRHVPTLVACAASEADAEMTSHLEFSAKRRSGEVSAVLVTEPSVCPFGSLRSAGLIVPRTGERGERASSVRRTLSDPELSEHGISDWLLNAKVERIPEITADNNAKLLDGGWAILALFNHDDSELRRQVSSIIEPLADLYEDRGGRLKFMTARADMYAHQFDLKVSDVAIVFRNLDGSDGSLETEIKEFSEGSGLEKLKSHLSKVFLASQLGASTKVGHISKIIAETEAKRLRDIFEINNATKQVLEADLDTVDNYPTFEYYLEKDGMCVADHLRSGRIAQDLCGFAQDIVKKRVLPALKDILREWTNQRLLESKKRPGKVPELRICNSFVRRYLPMERRSLNHHKDSSSTVTINILLSDLTDFDGGLAVFPEATTRDQLGPVTFPESGLGDAVIHRSDLYHGVQVKRGLRYSWIIWLNEECGVKS